MIGRDGGGASETTPKFTAHAHWTAARKGPAFFAYSDNYLIDTDHGIIMDVDASRSIRQAEVGAMRKMIDRTEDRFGLKPDWGAADTAYGSSDNLAWLTLKRKILPFIPVFDHSKRKDGTWSRSDFTWDEDSDRYICPEGKELRHTRRNYSDPKRHKAKAGLKPPLADVLNAAHQCYHTGCSCTAQQSWLGKTVHSNPRQCRICVIKTSPDKLTCL
ncbi:IS1182 family transposase ISRssp12 (plasmid) [Pseudoseohaeicola sp. NH-UV-7]